MLSIHGSRDNHLVDTWWRISSNSVSANELKSLRVLRMLVEIETGHKCLGQRFLCPRSSFSDHNLQYEVKWKHYT